MCAINFLANSAYSSIAPFYPNEAVGKGMPETWIGIVFASYSVAMVVFSPVFAALLFSKGFRYVLVLGCLSEGIAIGVFGTFTFIPSWEWFTIASIVCRFLEGFGNGCLNSGSQKLIMKTFPENEIAKMTGILQTFTGLGMLSGPVIGSLLFELGGFQLPFYSAGVLLLMLTFVVLYVIEPQSEEEMIAMQLEITESQRLSTGGDLNKKFGFWALLGRFQVITCGVCVSLSLASLTYREPILTLKLSKEMAVSTPMIGLIFALPTISYSLTSAGLQCIKSTDDGIQGYFLR